GGEPTRHQGSANDPTVPLERLLASFRPVAARGLPRFFGGAVGFVAYDVVRAFERLPATLPDELGIDDLCFVITDTLVIFDNLRQTVKVVANAVVNGPAEAECAYSDACARADEVVKALRAPAPVLRVIDPQLGDADSSEPLSSNTTRRQFCARVDRAKQYILDGDVFQVVLSQRFEAERRGTDPFDVYRALRVVKPSPYMYQLTFPGAQVAGASPAQLLRVEGNRVDGHTVASA